jgi:hypothetical protein
MIVGAVLSASSVSAQPFTVPSGSASSAGAPSDGQAATNRAQAAANSTLYGMTTTRSARYLLRNGLDYLNYQQYDRALKFLRDAETHKQDLNDAEKLVLKQGIEQAQRGLREAADGEAPYALSEQATRHRGFVPAKPDGSTVSATASQARRSQPTRQLQADTLDSERDDQARPIRLTSADVSNSQSGGVTGAGSQAETPLATDNSMPAGSRARTEQTSNMPVIPKLQPVLPLPDPTESTVGVTSERRSTPTTPSTTPAVSQPLLVPAATTNQVRDNLLARPEPARNQPVDQGIADAQSMDSSHPLPGITRSASPTPARPTEPATAPVTTPNNAEVPAGGQTLGTTPGQAQSPTALTLEPVPTATITALSPSDANLPATAHRETEDMTEPATLNANPQQVVPQVAPLESVRSTGQTVTSGRRAPAEVTPPPHRETEDLPQTQSPKTDLDPATAQAAVIEQTAALTQGAAALPPTVSASIDEKLPTLPSGLQPAAISDPLAAPTAHSPNTVAPAPTSEPTASTEGANTPQLSAPSTDELPQLPANLGQPRASTAIANQANMTGNAATPSAQPVTPDAGPSNLPSLPGQAEETKRTDALAISEIGTQTSAPPLTANSLPLSGDPASPAVSPSTTSSTSSKPDEQSIPPVSELPALPGAEASSSNSGGYQSQPAMSTNAKTPSADNSAVATQEGSAAFSTPASTTSGNSSTGSSDLMLPERVPVASSLRPEQQREVEELARRQDDELRQRAQNPPQSTPLPRDTTSMSDLRTQTQLDISRAPSPAEARPIKAIPVPEDWVPLAPRNWSPQRKYWAAAATCHLPLYFQDPVLERYGHSVEQYVGPVGRYLSYPVDDPTQSTQRNQIVQPFFSWGLFCFQIIAWPYNLVMDPPWEAQYDLGYYRPGDNIPTDLYWLPLHGYGPPLRGSNY